MTSRRLLLSSTTNIVNGSKEMLNDCSCHAMCRFLNSWGAMSTDTIRKSCVCFWDTIMWPLAGVLCVRIHYVNRIFYLFSDMDVLHFYLSNYIYFLETFVFISFHIIFIYANIVTCRRYQITRFYRIWNNFRLPQRPRQFSYFASPFPLIPV